MQMPHSIFKVMSVEIRQHSYWFITTLESLTPVVSTVDNRYWVPEDGINLLMKRIHDNAVKKYKTFFGEMEEPKENFIESIQILNEKPIKVKYKKASLLGHKVCLSVKSDEVSQKLAFTIMGCGLLEKNSIGFGYCRAK